jgi:diguanylate cyclase (GGDEF)-like protein/PAS domain S-box-containing protein
MGLVGKGKRIAENLQKNKVMPKTGRLQSFQAMEEMTSLYQQVKASEQQLQLQYEELKAKEEALRFSEERFLIVAEVALSAFWDVDVRTGQYLVSPTWNKTLRLPEVKTLDDFALLVYPDDQEKKEELNKEFLSGRKDEFEAEYRIKNMNGDYIWALSRGRAIEKDEMGRPVRIVGSTSDITEIKRRQEIERYQLTHDQLTGLYNRQGFAETVKSLLENGMEQGVVAVIDIDKFKLINDVYGPAHGDEVLIEFAGALTDCLMKNCFKAATIGRLAGDEFILFFPDTELKIVYETMAKMCRSQVSLKTGKLEVEVNVGFSVFPEHGRDILMLIQKALLANHETKKPGMRSLFTYDNGMQAVSERLLRINDGLWEALSNKELSLVFQPIFDIRGDRPVVDSFEALVRWKSKDLGDVPPDEFIPVAEDSGLILKIGERVMDETCQFIREALQEGGRPIVVFVNISMRQLLSQGFAESVKERIMAHEVPSFCLGIEITESIFATDFDACIDVLKQLGDFGIRIALDDFGTGYSSLTYLQRLPINVLKLDKNFVENLDNPEFRQDSVLADSIIRLSHEFGHQVVAEGVERRNQLEILKSQGCDRCQGYLFSRPMTRVDALELIKMKKTSI